jgi:hypothetical protein
MQSPSERARGAISVAATQAEAGDVDGALQTAEDHAEVWQTVAATRSRVGDVQGCRALAGRAPSSYIRALTLVGCAEGLIRRVRGATAPVARP